MRACLLSRGPAAASNPSCVRLSGQECRHGHTSHCHTISFYLGGAAYGLKNMASMAFSEKAAQQSLLGALLRRSNGTAHTQDTVASYRRQKHTFRNLNNISHLLSMRKEVCRRLQAGPACRP